MPDFTIDRRTPRLADAISAASSSTPGIAATQRDVLLCLVTARRAASGECAARLKAWCGLDVPAPGRAVYGDGVAVCWHGPDSWTVVTDPGPDLETELRRALGRSAAVVDLSDARVVLRLSGPMTRALLAKGVSIDVHPRVFRPGDAAVTLLSHVSVHLWQIDESPAFDLAIPRASANDIFHWLKVSADEFGLAAS